MSLFVSVIIPNYNGSAYLDACLSSVFNLNYKKFEVLVIDDGSTDESLQIINKYKRKYKNLILLKNERNMGASASRNKATSLAKGEIIFYLDNDTEVTQRSLSSMIKILERDCKIGAVQALILDFENREKIQMAGGVLIPQTAWLAPFFQHADYKKVKSRLDEREIVGISAALAVKKDVFNKISGFDEKEAVYTEDLDFCWRIWVAGYKVVLSPKSIVFHWSKSVAKRTTMNATYQKIYFNLAKNSFRSIIKNYQLLNIIKYLPISIFINLGRGFAFIVSRRSLAPLFGTFQAFYWTLANFGDTISSRRKIESIRQNQDDLIMDKVFTKESLFKIYKKYYA